MAIIHTHLASLAAAIKKIYDWAEPDVDFIIQEENGVPAIWWWGIQQQPMPTEAQLNAAIAQIAQKNKELELREIGNNVLIAAVTPYMDAEQKTWPIQVEEATKYREGKLDPINDIPFITNLAQYRGIPLADLVVLIEGNNDLFRKFAGQILGVQQNLLGVLYSIDLSNPVQAVATMEQLAWPPMG